MGRENPRAFATGVPLDVRPKGLEPLTFWLGVILDRFSRPKRDALDAEYEALCAEAAIR